MQDNQQEFEVKITKAKATQPQVELVVDALELKNALQRLSLGIWKRTTHPILQQVLIVVDKNCLRMQATSLDTWITTHISLVSTTLVDGDAIDLSFENLRSLISVSKITKTTKKQIKFVKAGEFEWDAIVDGITCKINSLSSTSQDAKNEFPVHPDNTFIHSAVLDLKKFKTSIEAVSYALAYDTTSAIEELINVQIKKDEVAIQAATNGKVALSSFPQKPEDTFTLFTHRLEKFIELMQGDTVTFADIKETQNSGVVWFYLADETTTVASYYRDKGTYPSLDHLIPTTALTKFKFTTVELQDFISAAFKLIKQKEREKHNVYIVVENNIANCSLVDRQLKNPQLAKKLECFTDWEGEFKMVFYLSTFGDTIKSFNDTFITLEYPAPDDYCAVCSCFESSTNTLKLMARVDISKVDQ